MQALVTGATGFIGRYLLPQLERPQVLVRRPDAVRRDFPTARAWQWSASEVPPDDAFDGVDTVFHLAGEAVARRWTTAAKKRIRASRVDGTRRLIEAIAARDTRPQVLVAASAVGFYGDRGDDLLDEESPPGRGFLADVCQQWEAQSLAARDLGVRVVLVRIGVVLGRGGGALAKMLLPFRLGLGATLGSGGQWFPWIHVEDLVALLLHAARSEELCGPLNGVAPAPVTNREFTGTLARNLRRPAWFRAPGFALRLGLGEMAEIVLTSARVTPRCALDSGFEFRYPELAGALSAILRP